MSNHGNIKRPFSAAAHKSFVQFTERCLLQDGIQIHRQYFFPAVYLLVRAGVRDHVRIRDHLAADIEENASYCGLCQ